MQITEQKPHPDDAKTMAKIEEIGVLSGDWTEALNAAYYAGNIRGRMEGAEEAAARVGKVLAEQSAQ